MMMYTSLHIISSRMKKIKNGLFNIEIDIDEVKKKFEDELLELEESVIKYTRLEKEFKSLKSMVKTENLKIRIEERDIKFYLHGDKVVCIMISGVYKGRIQRRMIYIWDPGINIMTN